MKLQQLKYLLAIVDNGLNITAAAERLYTSQPGVSKQLKLLEEELRIAGISYRVFGGTKFFDRKEIKDGIAYMRVALNPRDELSLRRIVNTPARGLGAQSLRLIVEYAGAHRMSLLRALRSAARIEGLSSRAAASAASPRAIPESSASVATNC